MIRLHLAGERFGRLLVIQQVPHGDGTLTTWECRCDCGVTRVFTSTMLRRGRARSCGCLFEERKQAKAAQRVKRHPEYAAWSQAKARCSDTGHQAYRHYGARGITMCPEWRNSFAAFLRDMGHRPTPKHTLDRIDNERGYSPDNCRWVTFKVQQNNRRSNHRIEWNGQTRTVTEWSEFVGLPVNAVKQRIKYGWPVERALTEPVRRRVSGVRP